MKTKSIYTMAMAITVAGTMMVACNEGKADQLLKERDSLAELSKSHHQRGERNTWRNLPDDGQHQHAGEQPLHHQQ